MTTDEIVAFAIGHFYAPHMHSVPIEEFALNRGLQYRLLEGCDRIRSTFGEVTKRDVVMLVEIWCTVNAYTRHKPLESKIRREMS